MIRDYSLDYYFVYFLFSTSILNRISGLIKDNQDEFK